MKKFLAKGPWHYQIGNQPRHIKKVATTVPVECIDTGKQYKSVKEAALDVGVTTGALSKAIIRDQSIKGLFFRKVVPVFILLLLTVTAGAQLTGINGQGVNWKPRKHRMTNLDTICGLKESDWNDSLNAPTIKPDHPGIGDMYCNDTTFFIFNGKEWISIRILSKRKS